MGQGSVRKCLRVTGIRDPQGDVDDCEERLNTFRDRVSLADSYLSDDPTRPRKRRFPAEAILEPGGYLLVWLNEDTADSPGLRANFKFNWDGKTLWLVDLNEGFNARLEAVTSGPLARDQAWGRSASQSDAFRPMVPSP